MTDQGTIVISDSDSTVVIGDEQVAVDAVLSVNFRTGHVVGLAEQSSLETEILRATDREDDLQADIDAIVANGGGDMLSTNNLSELSDPAVARANLGLGTAATHGFDEFATALDIVDLLPFPLGGAAGEVLGKLSGTDNDFGWIAQTGGGGSLPPGGISNDVLVKQSGIDGDALFQTIDATFVGADPTGTAQALNDDLVTNLGGAAWLNVGTTSADVAAGDAPELAVAAMPTLDTTDHSKVFFTTIDVGGGELVTFLDVSNLPSGVGSGDLLSTNNLSELTDFAAARANLGLGTAAVANTTAFDAAGAAAAAQAASQPLDSDLTSIAALTTTSYGRAFLTLADAAAGRTALGLGTAATANTTAFDAAGAAAAAQAAAIAASQPVDSDLTSIAALTTQSFGRSVLTAADAAGLRTLAGLGNSATLNVGTTAGTVAAGDDSRFPSGPGFGGSATPATPAPLIETTTGTTVGSTGATSVGYRKALVSLIDKATTAGDTVPLSVEQVFQGFVITDGVVSGTNLSSATGGFTSGMTGQYATARGFIPAGTTVTFVDANNLTLSAAGTSGSGLTVNINPLIATTGILARSFTPPDNGGDTSAILGVQTGGGVAVTGYKTAGRRPSGYTDYSLSPQGAAEFGTDGGSQAVIALAGVTSFGISGFRSAAVYARIDNSVSDGIVIAPNDATFDARYAWVVGNKNVNAAPSAIKSSLTLAGDGTMRSLAFTGLTGATQPSRFVGATSTGAPVSGTFIAGDYMVDIAEARMLICTVGGTPGTWAGQARPLGAATGDLTGSYPAPTLAAIGSATGPIGDGATVPVVTIDAKGRVTALTSTPITGAPPSGTAGGDLTGTFPNPTLTTSGVTAATYGSATQVAQVAFDAKGRATTASNVTIAIPESAVTNLTTDLAGKQPLDSDLTTIAGLTATTDNIIQSVGGAWASRTPTQVKAALAITEADVASLVTDLAGKQPLDSDLTTLASLTATTDNMIQSVAGAWASRTPAQVRTALALVPDTNIPSEASFTAHVTDASNVHLESVNPVLFISSVQSVAIPTGVRTVLPFLLNQSDTDAMHVMNTAATTITSGSNGQTLPQATINVADTTGFATTDYVVITGPSGLQTGVASDVTADTLTKTSHGFTSGMRVTVNGLSGTTGITNLNSYYVRDVTASTFKLATTLLGAAINLTGSNDAALIFWPADIVTMVRYTGKSGTTLTGGTLGVGTLATGMPVRPANWKITPVHSGIHIAQAQTCWQASDTGMRGTYIVQHGGGLDLEVGRQELPTTNTADQGVNVAAQPGFSAASVAAGDYMYIDVLQTSGVTLNCTTVGILAPGLGLARVTEFG